MNDAFKTHFRTTKIKKVLKILCLYTTIFTEKAVYLKVSNVKMLLKFC